MADFEVTPEERGKAFGAFESSFYNCSRSFTVVCTVASAIKKNLRFVMGCDEFEHEAFSPRDRSQYRFARRRGVRQPENP